METNNQSKQGGKTFNMKVKTQAEGESEKKWHALGNVYVRPDGSGGAVFLRKEDFDKLCTEVDEKGQVVIQLFPHEPKGKSNGKSESKSQAA